MPRTPRSVVPGLPHHITQRGNYRQSVFVSDGDRHFFLRRLADRAHQYEIDVLAWCLMSNHFHLIAIPRREDSFALGLRTLLSEYSLRMNSLRGEIRGHAWQSRYYSCALKRRHLWMALRYVELNPIRAKIVAKPEQYPLVQRPLPLGTSSVPAVALPARRDTIQSRRVGHVAASRGLAPRGSGITTMHLVGAGVRDAASCARSAQERAQERGTEPDFGTKVVVFKFGTIIRLRPSFLRHNGSSWWKQLSGPPPAWS